jgi:hypothetical protein
MRSQTVELISYRILFRLPEPSFLLLSPREAAQRAPDSVTRLLDGPTEAVSD